MFSASSYDLSVIETLDIEKGELLIGMKKCAAMALWGKPLEVKQYTDKSGLTEQWVYDGNKKINFLDAIVNSFSK
jgi:hypothetical protein